jgi:hypothetical protein
MTKRMLFAQQIGYERVHPCRREQAGRVVFGNQRSTLDFSVSVALEKIQKQAAQLRRSKFSPHRQSSDCMTKAKNGQNNNVSSFMAYCQ